ncbi:DUF7674 family protein [Methanobrevibacter sp.]
MTYDQLTSDYLCNLFPEFEKIIKDKQEYYDCELPHCLYSEVLTPFLKEFFKTQHSENEILVKRIFEFYENLAMNGDFESKNLLEVSLLEVLYENKMLYEGALKYMQNETRTIFKGLEAYLRIPD